MTDKSIKQDQKNKKKDTREEIHFPSITKYLLTIFHMTSKDCTIVPFQKTVNLNIKNNNNKFHLPIAINYDSQEDMTMTLPPLKRVI